MKSISINVKTQRRTIFVKQAYKHVQKQKLLDAYPVWHVYHAFLSNELQNTTMRNPLSSSITKFKQHRIINMQRCCKLNLILVLKTINKTHIHREKNAKYITVEQ
jgi:hypothetical protein